MNEFLKPILDSINALLRSKAEKSEFRSAMKAAREAQTTANEAKEEANRTVDVIDNYMYTRIPHFSNIYGTFTEFRIPRYITTIGRYAFYNCSNLKGIFQDDSDQIKYIEERSFENCKSLEKLPVDSLVSIGNYALNLCTALAWTSLPKTLKTIGAGAFWDCKSLAITSIPEGVTDIPSYAFYGCTSITSLTFEDTLESIGASAFLYCTNLTTVTFKGTPGSIGDAVFNNCTNLTTINVPWAEGEVANAPWGATNATINYNYTSE